MSITGQVDPLTKLQSEVVFYQRQAAVGAISAMLVHEINNLLQPVLMRAQDALERDDPAAMRKALEVADQQTRRAVESAQRLLALARDEEAPTSRCEISQLLQNAVAIVSARPFTKDRIEVTVAAAPGLHVEASPVLLEQLFVNLLDNARHALGRRGGHIRVQAQRSAGEVAVEIADDGVDADVGRIIQVIQPFVASDAAARPDDWAHAGLDLNVCRIVAQRLGGRLEARPNEPRGSRYRVLLPLAEAARPTRAPY